MANISRFHGQVRKCSCGLADQPAQQNLQACRICFGRGFVAECLGCDGKGQCIASVNGSDPTLGTMKSTCNACGGVGSFAVPKPADWADESVSQLEVTAQ